MMYSLDDDWHGLKSGWEVIFEEARIDDNTDGLSGAGPSEPEHHNTEAVAKAENGGVENDKAHSDEEDDDHHYWQEVRDHLLLLLHFTPNILYSSP